MGTGEAAVLALGLPAQEQPGIVMTHIRAGVRELKGIVPVRADVPLTGRFLCGAVRKTGIAATAPGAAQLAVLF